MIIEYRIVERTTKDGFDVSMKSQSGFDLDLFENIEKNGFLLQNPEETEFFNPLSEDYYEKNYNTRFYFVKKFKKVDDIIASFSKYENYNFIENNELELFASPNEALVYFIKEKFAPICFYAMPKNSSLSDLEERHLEIADNNFPILKAIEDLGHSNSGGLLFRTDDFISNEEEFLQMLNEETPYRFISTDSLEELLSFNS